MVSTISISFRYSSLGLVPKSMEVMLSGSIFDADLPLKWVNFARRLTEYLAIQIYH